DESENDSWEPCAVYSRSCLSEAQPYLGDLQRLADEIESVGVVADASWITHSQAVALFGTDGGELTRVCNDGTVRCVGSRKARKIDANSLARYMLKKNNLL